MVSKEAVAEITTVGSGLLIGLGLTNGALQQFEQGAAAAEWVPQLSFGVLIAAFLLIATVATRIGEDPAATDGFTLAHWALVVGLSVTTTAGITYLALDFSVISSAAHVVTGVGGLLFMVREWRIRSVRIAA